jgi:hypothetical protein
MLRYVKASAFQKAILDIESSRERTIADDAEVAII